LERGKERERRGVAGGFISGQCRGVGARVVAKSDRRARVDPVFVQDSRPEVGDNPNRWVPPVSGEKQKKKKIKRERVAGQLG
jgi:hypothetical protein